MGNQLAHLPTHELVLDSDRMELLRKTIANGAPQLEFEMFVADCNRRGLDPFAKQTYLIKRGDKWQQQTSIDGYRLIADRTGKYAGSDEAIYAGDIGEFPERASVTVWKLVAGQRCPFTAAARWDEYYPGDKLGHMWRKMPYVMLAKCAESLALRKAFPQELSGLYTREEMQQAETPQYQIVDVTTGEIEYDIEALDATEGGQKARDDFHAAERNATDRDKAIKRYFAILHERGITDEERKALQKMAYGVDSAKDLTTAQIKGLTDRIEQRSNDELRQAIAQNAPDRASEAGAPETTTDTFDPVQAAEMFTRDIQNASTWAAAQAAARMATDIQVSTPELERAKADAYNKFHPKQETVIDVAGGPVNE